MRFHMHNTNGTEHARRDSRMIRMNVKKRGGGAAGIYTEKSNNINSDQLDPKLV